MRRTLQSDPLYRLLSATIFLCAVCFPPASAQDLAYHKASAKPLSRFTPDQLALLSKLNHADYDNLAKLKSIVVPDRWDLDELLYSPMPQKVMLLSDETRALVVDLAAQVFGAYERGKLVRWGPVSSGDRRHQTPPGAYHLTWRAFVHTSTENPKWVMPWYFNFANDLGLAVHQYALPGRPASHGCVRLLAVDAEWIFNWGEEWALTADTRELVHQGTPVLILGSYNFAAAEPWRQPEWWTQGVILPAELIANLR